MFIDTPEFDKAVLEEMERRLALLAAEINGLSNAIEEAKKERLWRKLASERGVHRGDTVEIEFKDGLRLATVEDMETSYYSLEPVLTVRLFTKRGKPFKYRQRYRGNISFITKADVKGTP